MRRKILVLILGIFIFISSGCGADNSTKEKVSKDIESNNKNKNLNSSANEVVANYEESTEVESVEGYVLKVDKNNIYVDAENTEGRIYTGEGNDRAIIYDISNAEIDSPRGIRVGITVSIEYHKENGVNIATHISSDGDEKEPIPIKEIAFNWLDDERKESIINMDNAKIEKVTYKEDYFVVSNEESINIKDKVVYKVTFDTSAEVLGPIVIYLDKDNGEVLGTEIRK